MRIDSSAEASALVSSSRDGERIGDRGEGGGAADVELRRVRGRDLLGPQRRVPALRVAPHHDVRRQREAGDLVGGPHGVEAGSRLARPHQVREEPSVPWPL